MNEIEELYHGICIPHELIELDKNYTIIGNLVTGKYIAECEYGHVPTEKYQITRPISYITNDKIQCMCGRIFWKKDCYVYTKGWEKYSTKFWKKIFDFYEINRIEDLRMLSVQCRTCEHAKTDLFGIPICKKPFETKYPIQYRAKISPICDKQKRDKNV